MRGELCYEASVESEVHEVERGMWRVRGEERERERGAGGSQRGGGERGGRASISHQLVFCVVVFR